GLLCPWEVNLPNLFNFLGWGISFITPIVFDKLGDENVFLNTFYVSFVGGLGYLICTAIGEIFPRKFLMSVTFFIYGVITLLVRISIFGITKNRLQYLQILLGWLSCACWEVSF